MRISLPYEAGVLLSFVLPPFGSCAFNIGKGIVFLETRGTPGIRDLRFLLGELLPTREHETPRSEEPEKGKNSEPDADFPLGAGAELKELLPIEIGGNPQADDEASKGPNDHEYGPEVS